MNKKIIAVSATQGCFGINTPIRMYDGTIKMVQDIEVGDVVMGNDSTPRNVLLLHRGKEELFEFEYIDGIKHTYNKSHELILQYSQTKGKRKKGDLLIDTVANYLNFSTDKKRVLCKFSSTIERFLCSDLKIPPYILGVWLGDGTKAGTKITNTDECILQELSMFAVKNKLCLSQVCSDDITYNIVSTTGKYNPFLNSLRFYNLLYNKHIPLDYFNSSLQNRLSLLAGIVDTDGYLDKRNKRRFEITQKNKKLAEDIFYLARSCGIHATLRKITKVCVNNGKKGTYYSISLTRNIYKIPCKLTRKKVNKPNNPQRPTTRVGIRKITSLGIGNYYGFTLDGNNLFLHADCTVLKNCGKTTIVYGIATFLKKLGKNVAVINELARECPFPINQEADDRTQSWIANKQLTKEFEKMDRYDYLVVDRSVLDPICYSLFLGKPEWVSLLQTDYLVAHVKTYYKKLYLLDPVLFDWNIKDGIRDTDTVFRNGVHDQMLNLFEKHQLPYKLIHSSEEIYSDLVKL